MLTRSIVVAVLLTAAPAAFAEPPKPQAQKTRQPSDSPIVLAAAEAVKAPVAASPDQQAPAKRPRVARVTTCRCGDPIPQNDEDQQ